MKFLKLGIFLMSVVLGSIVWYTRPIWIGSFSLSLQDPIGPENLIGEFDSTDQSAIFNNRKLSVPKYIADKPKERVVQKDVLGDTASNKRIEVDLTNQRLYAYEGDRLVYNFLVSTGKWGRTPTGTFRIWVKLRYTKMSGGNQALGTYYYLPNVPFVMFFSGPNASQSAGYSLHGTYWHNNFGHPMSHGCVNMKTEEVEQIYYWAQPDLRGKNSIHSSADNPGTEIIIYGNAPWD